MLHLFMTFARRRCSRSKILAEKAKFVLASESPAIDVVLLESSTLVDAEEQAFTCFPAINTTIELLYYRQV